MAQKVLERDVVTWRIMHENFEMAQNSNWSASHMPSRDYVFFDYFLSNLKDPRVILFLKVKNQNLIIRSSQDRGRVNCLPVR